MMLQMMEGLLMKIIHDEEKFSKFLIMKSNEASFKAKIFVNMIYCMFFILYAVYSKFVSIPIYLLFIILIVLSIVLEKYKKLKYQYYLIKFAVLIFILNLTILNWKFALALTFLSILCYLWQRKRELVSLYNCYEGNSSNDYRGFALTVGAGSILFLRVTNISFENDIWWLIILLLMNIFFAIEFNLINDLYDVTYVKLLKIDKYIKNTLE